MKFNIYNSEFSLLTRMYTTRCFIASAHAFNLATRTLSFIILGFEFVTCRFGLVTFGFELVGHISELVSRYL